MAEPGTFEIFRKVIGFAAELPLCLLFRAISNVILGEYRDPHFLAVKDTLLIAESFEFALYLQQGL